jgi:hypothetical protein
VEKLSIGSNNNGGLLVIDPVESAISGIQGLEVIEGWKSEVRSSPESRKA